MTGDVYPDEKKIIAEALQRMRSSGRHCVSSQQVKLFLQIIGDELARTGELTNGYVDQIVERLKSGEL